MERAASRASNVVISISGTITRSWDDLDRLKHERLIQQAVCSTDSAEGETSQARGSVEAATGVTELVIHEITMLPARFWSEIFRQFAIGRGCYAARRD